MSKIAKAAKKNVIVAKKPAYKRAGVDVEAGDALVDWLTASGANRKNRIPHADKIVSGIGGFAALFRANFKNMKSPCLVSSTDGVGTKVKIAAQFSEFKTVGQDLVAMCVNDLVCVGAEPLFFLDYYATGKLNLKNAQDFLAGVRKACHDSGCALIGGETAEMPGVYHGRDFDCAGFAVGVVDEKKALGAHRVKVGDRLIGIESSGFHSNGYSLLRKAFARDMAKWKSRLMIPTHLYAKLILNLAKKHSGLHAIANVTGGGLDNLLRVIPRGTALSLNAWPVPAEFIEVKKRAKMSWEDLLKTLNCGIGMVLYVDKKSFAQCQSDIRRAGYKAYDLGEVVQSQQQEWRLDYTQFEERK